MRHFSRRGGRVAHLRIPLWLMAVALIPAAAIFFASLLLAVAIAGLGAAAFFFLGPLFTGQRRAGDAVAGRRPVEHPDEIELDASSYRRIPHSSERGRRN